MIKEYMVVIEGQEHKVVVSDETEALLAAKAAGKAFIGLWSEAGSQDLSIARFVAESVDAVSKEYLEQVVRRHLGKPWVIAETKRLVIREFQIGDEMQIRPDPGEGEDGGVFRSRELLREYIQHQYGFYGYGIWAVTHKESGKIAGKAGVVNLTGQWEHAEKADALELGYHIFSPYRRQGLALEACQGVLEWYQSHMDCPLYAKIDAFNKASIRVVQKLGFSLKDRIYTESGQWLYLYGWNY